MPNNQPLKLLLFAALLACVFWQLTAHPLPSLANTSPAIVSATSWRLPLDPPALLVRGYRSPNSDYSAGHRGVDYAVEDGQPLYAPTSGVIAFAGLVANKPVVAIAHRDGYRTTFEPACSDLPAGKALLAGAMFGSVCRHGYHSHCAPALCLHFALRRNEGYLSPLALIGGLAPSVLTR